MNHCKVIGIDTAKHSFALHGADAAGGVVSKFKCPTFGNLICLTFGNFIPCGRRRRERSDRRLLRVSPSLRTCRFVLPHAVAGALDIHHMATMQ